MHKITQIEINLASRVAKEYAKTNRIEIEDAVSYGLEALVKAAEKYCPEKGDFQSYAATWIKKHLSRYWRDRTQVPRSVQEMYFKANKLAKRNVSDDEICDRMSLSKIQLDNCRLLMKYYYYKEGTIGLDEKKMKCESIPDFNSLLACFCLRERLDESTKEKIIQMQSEKFNVHQISKSMGIPYATVRSFLIRYLSQQCSSLWEEIN